MALGSQHPAGAMLSFMVLSSMRCPHHGMDGVRNEETRAKLYTKGSHTPLVISFTTHFVALTFSFLTSKVESATFILNDTLMRKKKKKEKD